MKEKIFKYLCSFPEIDVIFRDTMFASKSSKWGNRIKKIPYMLKVICVNRSKRRKKYNLMKSEGNVCHITKYDEDILVYLPYISYKDGMISGDLIQKIIFLKNDFYEAEELHYVREKYLKNAKNMLDIGSNIGNHTIFFSKIAKFEKVFSFEPVTETYNILKKNVEINKLKGVTTYNVGLGEKEANADILQKKEDNCGATQLEYNENGGIRIMAVDQLNIIDRIDFIKIDVEGFELGVLKGAKDLIGRDNPIIFIEIFPENYHDIVELMNEYGYCIEETIGHDNYIFMKKV